MSKQKEPEQDFASVAALVEAITAIYRAQAAFPSDEKIGKLAAEAGKLLDPIVIQAIVLQNSALQGQMNSQRQSPLASQLLK